MSDNSAIEWTDATWNPLLGCTKVSPGCDNCYAIVNATIRQGNPNEKVAAAYRGLVRHGEWTGRVNLLPDRLDQPIRWRKPRKIFVNSQSDLFHDKVPDHFIVQVFAVMASTPRHTYQILTKRHARMRTLLADQFFQAAVRAKMAAELRPAPGQMVWPLPNVWLGVSVEDQRWARIRIPELLRTPAAVRWLSCEPLLGEVDVWRWLGKDVPVDTMENPDGWENIEGHGIDWVVAGGESGPGARPMHPDWARKLRDQCVEADVPFLFKQWGQFRPVRVVDAPTFYTGRAIELPTGGLVSASIREPGPTGTMRTAVSRAMEPGDRNGHGVMLDRDTVAYRMTKSDAGRELDGRTWDEYPAVRVA